MGRINVLGFDVANLIAAGEVVDRPSSVVKELLENSIDAGANMITVEIQRGGVAFIRISDNGCGMEPEDLPVSILRHATSKISGAEDLSHIGTLGFRGEALAAISSVSRMRIFSRPHDSLTGAMLTADGGEVLDITETGCAEGTTVVVEELFYNVPARRKFLKKDSTEAAAVGALVEKIALSRPDISIKYICDGDMKFYTQGDGKLLSAIRTIFGRDAASRMIAVERSADGISVTGYTSEPDIIKSTRNMENFFVNGRFVRSKTVMAAVEQAYRTRIPADKFPFCVLNIDINPTAVDVNVHPAKLEIKFTNERIIFDAVYYAVLNALASAVVRPELNLFPGRKEDEFPYTNPAGARQKSDAKTPPYGSGASVTSDAAGISGRQIPTGAERTVARTSSGATVQKSTSPTDALRGTETSAQKPPSPTDALRGAGAVGSEAGSEVPKSVRRSEFWIDGNEARRLLGAFVPADVKEKLPEQTSIPFRETPAAAAKNEDNKDSAKRESVREADRATDQNSAVSETVRDDHTGDAVSAKVFLPIEEYDSDSDTSAKFKPIESLYDNAPPEDSGDYIILGEAYNTYVILQLADRLLFVDKHAAHERIIFDELCRKMKSEQHARGGQLLLVPLRITALEIETDALEDYGDRIRALGFDYTVEKHGGSTNVSISQIPDMLTGDEAAELFHTLISQLSEVGTGVEAAAEEFFEARLFQSACKAAIKGGRVYDQAHIRWICDRLVKKPGEDGSVIRTCPHGRPVAFEVKKSSIDRQFARIG